jgi:hypothetical protein
MEVSWRLLRTIWTMMGMPCQSTWRTHCCRQKTLCHLLEEGLPGLPQSYIVYACAHHAGLAFAIVQGLFGGDIVIRQSSCLPMHSMPVLEETQSVSDVSLMLVVIGSHLT